MTLTMFLPIEQRTRCVILKPVTFVFSDRWISPQMLCIDLLLPSTTLPLRVAGFSCFLNSTSFSILNSNAHPSMFVSVNSTEEEP